MHLVIVADNEARGRSLVKALNTGGHGSTWCRLDAVAAIHALNADAVLVDFEQVGPGIAVLQRLRRITTVPVVALFTEDHPLALGRVLGEGVEGYLIDPVGTEQLLKKVEQVVHRAAVQAKRVVVAMDVTIDLGARTVRVGNTPISLTAKEFDVLAVLAHHAGRVVSRRNIEETVWGEGGVRTSRSLNVHMTTLRAKLNRPTLIQTVHGFGYRFGPPPEPPAGHPNHRLEPQRHRDRPGAPGPSTDPSAGLTASGTVRLSPTVA